MFLLESAKPMHLAARPRVVAKYLGALSVALAVLLLVPVCYQLAASEGGMFWTPLLTSAVLLALGVPASRIRCENGVQSNEALVVVALIFVVAAAAFAILMRPYGLSWSAAIFEAVSGVSTTGLSVLADVEQLPRALLLIRAWSQWVGGLGIVVLALALLIDPGPAAVELGVGQEDRIDLVGGTRAHARRVLLVYLVLTAAGILLLKGAGLDLFEAVAQALAAVSTGGFSTRDASLAAFSAPAVTFAMLLSFLGSLSFAWYFGARYRGLKDTVFDPRFLAMLVLCLLGATLVAVLSPALTTFQAVTTAVSAQTTVGFATADVHAVAPAARLALIFSMLVGGQIGSTAGGIKILRLLLLLRLLQVALSRVSVAASARLPLRFAGRPLQMRHLEAAAAILTGYLVAIAVSWFLFLLYGYDALDSLFDIASAIGTVGLSTGVVSPHLEPGLRAVLCVDMLMGRLETIALVVLIFPGTWIGRRRRSQ